MFIKWGMGVTPKGEGSFEGLAWCLLGVFTDVGWYYMCPWWMGCSWWLLSGYIFVWVMVVESDGVSLTLAWCGKTCHGGGSSIVLLSLSSISSHAMTLPTYIFVLPALPPRPELQHLLYLYLLCV